MTNDADYINENSQDLSYAKRRQYSKYMSSHDSMPPVNDFRWKVWSEPLLSAIQKNPMTIEEIETWAVMNEVNATFNKHLLAYLEDRRLVYFNAVVWCFGYKRISRLELNSVVNEMS